MTHAPKYSRLSAIENMTRDQMKSMLAFLSGYTNYGWDKAYEVAMGKALSDESEDYGQPDAISAYPKLDANMDYGQTLLEEYRNNMARIRESRPENER